MPTLRTLFSPALALLVLATAGIPSSQAGGPLTLAPAPGGRLHAADNDRIYFTLTPAAANKRWSFSKGRADGKGEGGAEPFVMPIDESAISGSLRVRGGEGNATADWTMKARDAVAFNTLAAVTDFDVAELVGTPWQADDRRGEFPAQFGQPHLFGGLVRKLVLKPTGMPELVFTFPKPTMVLLQDNRLWGDSSYTLRIGRGDGEMAAGEEFTIAMTLEGAAFTGTAPASLRPVVMEANDEWIPLRQELEIVPGSALDLTSQEFIQGPCGTKGRVITTPEGHFAFAKEPNKPQRFYGINFCYSAQFLSKEKVDRLLDRLVLLGYNTVRIHHYESGLTNDKPGFDWDPAKVDQLDYLMAGCAKRGLWLTTDLYVSRPVSAAQIGQQGGEIEMDRFKMRVPVDEKAFQDWCTFSRKFLDRVNPYTGVRIAEDPALAWLSLINEGPLANFWSELRQIPEWQSAWTSWLSERYPTKEALDQALGAQASAKESGGLKMAMPGELTSNTPASRLASIFVAEMERKTYERMRDFLRKDLRCEALLTNMNNAAARLPAAQLARASFDYVDEHFYVDHPQFLERPWRLPSASPNANPIPAGAPGGINVAAARVFGKPFTITEYNYAGPGRFRGVGGILTGALGAIQDWDAMWRFAYSHDRRNLFEPAPIGYFDLVSDPLNQAADRLTLFLFLRGDLAPASDRLAVVLPEAEIQNPQEPLDLTTLYPAGWQAQIGTVVLAKGAEVPPGIIPLPANPALAKSALPEALKQIGTDSAKKQVTIDAKNAILAIDSPKSAGGYAEKGQAISTSSVEIRELTHGATVFVNSLDAAPISSSRRLLVTHLTDLQNTAGRYAEGSRQTLLDWGGLPHLVRDGSAQVRIATADADKLTVWALAVNGRRIEKVPSKIEDGRLVFTASVKGSEGAQMLYEVAEK
jgi:hypothetical protein